MTIAQKKHKENIAEYVLYVWQMEDLLRASSLDAEGLFSKFGYEKENEASLEEMNWLKSLAQRMKSEGLEKSGHVSEIQSILAELFLLHNTLISILKDKKYLDLFSSSEPHINGLMTKTDGQQNLVEHVLIALYGLLILRLQKKEIGEETKVAMASFSSLMGYLSLKYKEMKTGQLNSELN